MQIKQFITITITATTATTPTTPTTPTTATTGIVTSTRAEPLQH